MTRSIRTFLKVLSFLTCIFILTSQARASALKIVEVMSSCEFIEPDWPQPNQCYSCLLTKVKPGLKVTLLGAPLYRTRTGDTMNVYLGEGDITGTQLQANVDSLKSYHDAVIGDSVFDYKRLDVIQVTKQSTIDSAMSRFEQNEPLRALLAWREESEKSMYSPIKVYQTSFPRDNVFIIDHPYSPIIIYSDTIFNLFPVGGSCSHVTRRAFRLNNRFFLKVWHCDCESDCRHFEFVELKP